MTVHVLIRGDLPDVWSDDATAHVMATCRVIGQESAEAIVGARKQARRNGKPGKTYPAEGPNTEKGKNIYELL